MKLIGSFNLTVFIIYHIWKVVLQKLILIYIYFSYRRRRAGKLGIGSACIGGGQGIAVMVEVL